MEQGDALLQDDLGSFLAETTMRKFTYYLFFSVLRSYYYMLENMIHSVIRKLLQSAQSRETVKAK